MIQTMKIRLQRKQNYNPQLKTTSTGEGMVKGLKIFGEMISKKQIYHIKLLIKILARKKLILKKKKQLSVFNENIYLLDLVCFMAGTSSEESILQLLLTRFY